MKKWTPLALTLCTLGTCVLTGSCLPRMHAPEPCWQRAREVEDLFYRYYAERVPLENTPCSALWDGAEPSGIPSECADCADYLARTLVQKLQGELASVMALLQPPADSPEPAHRSAAAWSAEVVQAGQMIENLVSSLLVSLIADPRGFAETGVERARGRNLPALLQNPGSASRQRRDLVARVATIRDAFAQAAEMRTQLATEVSRIERAGLPDGLSRAASARLNAIRTEAIKKAKARLEEAGHIVASRPSADWWIAAALIQHGSEVLALYAALAPLKRTDALVAKPSAPAQTARSRSAGPNGDKPQPEPVTCPNSEAAGPNGGFKACIEFGRQPSPPEAQTKARSNPRP